MTSLSDLLAQGTAHAWLFVPTAILLGALHGLEPGHSKTMMAAFIIAVRGTVKQAVLLGLCATLSHTVIVWVTYTARPCDELPPRRCEETVRPRRAPPVSINGTPISQLVFSSVTGLPESLKLVD
jgi:hypothetical protein